MATMAAIVNPKPVELVIIVIGINNAFSRLKFDVFRDREGMKGEKERMS